MAGKTESAALTHKNLVKSRIEFPAVFFSSDWQDFIKYTKSKVSLVSL